MIAKRLALLGASMAAITFTSPALAGPAACANLAKLRPSFAARITTAEAIDANKDRPWKSPAGFGGSIAVDRPFCRVSGVIAPTPKSDIKFELWLPLPDAWTGRFYGTASGASMGAIQFSSLGYPLSLGYAAMGHDNGHQSANFYEQSWAFDEQTRQVRRERIVDFASRAQHVSTVVAKEVARAFYGKPVSRSYYVGCSQGGHHGIMEAERYPNDYDGIVSGAHGGNWMGMMSSQAWAAYNVLRNDRAGALSTAQLLNLNSRVMAACDANDGLVDGQIEDPRTCRFDPAVLQCRAGESGDTCLTPAQVEATRAIYQGPRDPATGRQLSPGFPPGSERFWSWNTKAELRSGSYYDFYRLIINGNPDWNFLTAFDWSRDVTRARTNWGPVYNAVTPNLSPFARRGGKLLMYHGWADPLITPGLSIETWDRLRGGMGAKAMDGFMRLYMVPGMEHCSGGPIGGTRATQEVAWLTAIRKWVEDGIAPDGTTPANTVVGTSPAGLPARTRPYCPYPTQARYRGTGSIDDASSFTCRAPSR